MAVEMSHKMGVVTIEGENLEILVRRLTDLARHCRGQTLAPGGKLTLTYELENKLYNAVAAVDGEPALLLENVGPTPREDDDESHEPR